MMFCHFNLVTLIVLYWLNLLKLEIKKTRMLGDVK